MQRTDNYETEQESFWAGDFGNGYIDRNNDIKIIASNLYFFSKILSTTKGVRSLIEFGSNVGLNIIAIKKLLPEVELSALEINKMAAEELKKIEGVKFYNTSILNFVPDYQRDFVLVKGFLIRIDPQKLALVYDMIYRMSRKYICIAEYYNPTPVEVKYRGHDNRLFKRDFAGEMLDRFQDLTLIDYGFNYHRDNNFPHNDDTTWFLISKQ